MASADDAAKGKEAGGFHEDKAGGVSAFSARIFLGEERKTASQRGEGPMPQCRMPGPRGDEGLPATLGRRPGRQGRTRGEAHDPALLRGFACFGHAALAEAAQGGTGGERI